MSDRKPDIQHWEPGARMLTGDRGRCRERECGGTLVLVDALGGGIEWCQCNRCRKQVGVGVQRAAAAPVGARGGEKRVKAPARTGDPFLDAT